MQKVGTGLVIGLIGQLALLIALGATVSLSIFGWAVGVGYGVFTTVTLGRALTRAGATRLGPANRVTLARAMLVGGVAALTADSFVRPAAVTALVAISVIALALDAVDGWVARRTNSVTPLGARFDREVDAFLILVLSVYVAHSTGQWWVLLIGAARYAYGAAGWLLPWLRGSLPPRYWGKVVAAIQGIVLTIAAADILPIALMNVALGVALVLLVESFGSSVWWLWQQRQPTDVPAVEMAVAAVHVDGSGVDGAGVDGGEQEPAGRRDGPKHRLPRRSGLRTAAAWSATILACLLVWFALVAPNDLSQLTLGAFLRLPVEGLIVVAIALVLPPAPRRILAAVVGVILGLLTILKLFDMGFFEAFDRPFNPVADWTYGGSAVDLLIDSIGRTGAIAVVIAAVALIVGLLILMPLALVRLTRLASEHRTISIRSVTAIGAVWILCAAFGLQIVQGAPIASASAAELTYDQVSQVRDGIAAQEAFGAAVADDPFDSAPAASVTTPPATPTPTATATTPPLTSTGATPAALPPMLKAAQATQAPAAPTATGKSRARQQPAVGPEGQGRHHRLRRELWAGRGPGFVVLGRGRCGPRRRDRSTSSGRVLRQERIPHLTDVRRHQLAGPLDTAVRTVGGQPGAVRPTHRQQSPDAHQRVPTCGLADGRGHAGDRAALAGGRSRSTTTTRSMTPTTSATRVPPSATRR